MNLHFTVTFTLLQAVVCISVVFLAFFAGKSRKLAKSQKRIAELENEMLTCHREILELQQMNQRGNNKYNTVDKPEFKVLSMGR